MVAAAEIKLVDGERLSRPGSSSDLDRGNIPDSKSLEKSTSVKSLDLSSSLLLFHKVGLPVQPAEGFLQFITNVSCPG